MKTIDNDIKYSKKPIEFLRDNWIDIKNGNLKRITPYEFQEKIITDTEENKINIIASCRQSGLSSLIDVYIAWKLIFGSDENILITSHNLQAAILHIDRIRNILYNYASDSMLDYKCFRNNKKEIIIGNNRVTCKAASRGVIGDSYSLIFIDNAGFIDELESIYKSIIPCILAIKNSKLIIASSANKNSFFNKLAIEIKDNEKSNFKLTQIKWNDMPSRDQQWLEEQKLILGNNQDIIDQELNCVLTFEERTVKDKYIGLRVPEELFQKITTKIKKTLSMSDYLRGLIEKDINSNCLESKKSSSTSSKLITYPLVLFFSEIGEIVYLASLISIPLIIPSTSLTLSGLNLTISPTENLGVIWQSTTHFLTALSTISRTIQQKESASSTS